MKVEKKIEWEEYKHNAKKPDDDEDDEENERGPQSIIQTPFGLFKLDDSMNPFKQFKFWLANTNFTLTPRIKLILDNMEGVESLIFITKYRFIIGIGKMFDDKTVKGAIDKILTKSIKYLLFTEDRYNTAVRELQIKLESTSKIWAIYVFPNGNVDFCSNDDVVEVAKKFLFYKKAQSLSRGHVIVSPDLKQKMDNEKKNK